MWLQQCLHLKGNINVTAAPETLVSFKNCAPFIKHIKKIWWNNNRWWWRFRLVIPMYNLIEHCSNYYESTGSLLFYSKDEATNYNAVITNDNNFKSFKYKTKPLGKAVVKPNPNYTNKILINATIAAPIKYLSNFWRSLKMPLINCKVELKLKWTICVFSAASNKNTNVNPDNIIFTINDTKLYLAVVTLSKDNQKLSEILSSLE